MCRNWIANKPRSPQWNVKFEYLEIFCKLVMKILYVQQDIVKYARIASEST